MKYNLKGLDPKIVRAIRYVVGLVKENQGRLFRFEVIRDTRLRDRTGEIGFLDAYNAVVIAEERGIILARRVDGDRRFDRRGSELSNRGNSLRYFTKEFIF